MQTQQNISLFNSSIRENVVKI